MSFVKNHLRISEYTPAKQLAHQYKLCSKCETMKPPEGGVEMGPGRWRCASCWTVRATRTKK